MSSLALLLSLLIPAGWSADPPTLAPPKVPKAPEGLDQLGGLLAKKPDTESVPLPHAVLLFQDRSAADCPPVDGFHGDCVEEVDFVSRPSAKSSRPDVAEWRSFGRQNARVWESLAYRWSLADDPLLTTMEAGGFTALPEPKNAWDRTPVRRRTVSTPDAANTLKHEEWFAPVLYRVSQGSHTPDMVRLTGRFATRLGYDGKPFPFELMDARVEDSSPFFEQMFPYNPTGSTASSPTSRPLGVFGIAPFPKDATPDAIKGAVGRLMLPDGASWADMTASATREFLDFRMSLSVAVTQFALEDYTVNQARILTSLAGMIFPPGNAEASGTAGRSLVAASVNETDVRTEELPVDLSSFALRDRFRLNVIALPDSVTDAYLVKLLQQRPADADAPANVAAGVRDSGGVRVRGDVPPPINLTLQALESWSVLAAAPGEEPGRIRSRAAHVALAQRLDLEPPESRARWESWLLIDHAAFGASEAYGPAKTAPIASADLVLDSTQRWVSAVSKHGFRPRPIPQGLGAIDPTAICTTLDGTAAQKEAVIKPVTVDLLIAGDNGLETAGEVLWAGRERLPFVMIDNPGSSIGAAGQPELARLTGLPGNRALYRVRWRIWAGWHMFWTTEAVSGGGARIAARTGAVCDDLTLTSPENVPTLMHAALLMDDGRSPDRVPTFPRRPVAGAAANEDTYSYLRSRVFEPIRAISRRLGGLLLLVMEGDRERIPTLSEWIPPTPYSRHGRGKVRTAAWGLWFEKEKEPAPMWPLWRPGESVASDSLRPSWHQRTETRMTTVGGLGVFPIRQISTLCTDVKGSAATVAPCIESGRPSVLESQGVSADAAVLGTVWLQEAPRWGVEGGVGMLFDIGKPGVPYTDGSLEYTMQIRPAAGLLLGLRLAPGLHPIGSGRRGLGLWGGERTDGQSVLGRWQWGLRGGVMLSPGFDGLEATGVGELWAGASARREHANVASFTPYKPNAFYGLFVRGQYAVPLASSGHRYQLDNSLTLSAGLRGTWDVELKLPKPPEAK